MAPGAPGLVRHLIAPSVIGGVVCAAVACAVGSLRG
jgi:hypothetical protein